MHNAEVKRGKTLLDWITNKNNSKKGVVGIEVTTRGVAVAHLKAKPSLELTQYEYIETADQQVAIDRLQEAVASFGLKGLPCNIALSPEYYSILLSEVPNVPEDELRDAMRWRIKDLSPIPVDQAVVDVFKLPEDAGSIGKGMAFTVVAQQKAVENSVALVNASGLKINAIDVPELCLRNIAELAAQPSRSIVIARLLEKGSHITAVCDGNVYLNRHFSLRYTGGSIPDDQAESLTLELQRSVDYIQHQMRQPTPSHIFLLGRGITDKDVPASLDASFAAEVKALNLSEYMATPAGMDDDILNRSAIAIGAALRDFNKQDVSKTEAVEELAT